MSISAEQLEMIINNLRLELNDRSRYRLISLGIVIANKSLERNDIIAIPIEIAPLVDGQLDPKLDTSSIDTSDAYGNKYSVKMTSSNGIPCKWRTEETNRITAPDVRVGELVDIYQFGDNDEYYWEATNLTAHLRRLETVVYLYSADPDGTGNEDRTIENSYSVTISTHKKMIHIKTTMLNGEKVLYDAVIDPGSGVAGLMDDKGNMIEVDSEENIITLINAEGSFLKLNKKDIELFANNNIQGTAKKNISLTADQMDINIAKSCNLKATTFNVTAETNIKGNTSINGSLGVSGNSTFTGSSTFNGDMTSTGVVSVRKLISQENIAAPNV